MKKKIFLLSAPSEGVEVFYKKRQHELKIFGKMRGLDPNLYSLGIAYLGAVLEKEGHATELSDFFNIPLSIIENSFLKKIEDEKPDIIGFSILTMNKISSFKLIKKIKKINPNIKIIVGGVHCSTLYEQILINYPVDLVCVGEGESIINDIAKYIDNPLKLKKVKGIAFMSNKKLIKTKPVEPIKDLDSLPFPKHESFLNEKSNVAHMSTSRGCTGDCTFCSTRQYWGCRWRARSAKNVVDEMEYIKKKFPNIKLIWFYDDTFTLNNQRVIDICKKLIERKIKISWLCGGRVHPISLEMLNYMKRAGCKLIMLGIESGSEMMLKSMKKYITREQIINAFKLSRKAGIKVGACLLVGLPGESDGTVNETIDLLKKINFAAPGVGILEIYPNTEIYELAKQKGFIDDSYWLTEKKIPIYTCELPIKKLRRMAFRIIYESHKNKGILCLSQFIAKKILFHPSLAIQNIKNLFF